MGRTCTLGTGLGSGRMFCAVALVATYLWECLQYVELNMVRCGAVAHPDQWEWSGYGE
jgi:hypothetical protein